MKPNFALHLDPKGITLLHRTNQGWHRTGEISFDDPDWSEKLGFLQKTASALAPNGITTKLLLPDSQILYTSVTAPGPEPAARRARIAEALDGLTPYRIDELVFDWCDSSEPGVVRVAAVARETLDEAETFARQRGFNPLYFAARPSEEKFPGEPFFGTTAMARTLIPEDETLERDTEPTRETPPPRVVPHAVPPRDQPPGSLDTLLALSERLHARSAQDETQDQAQRNIPGKTGPPLMPVRNRDGAEAETDPASAATKHGMPLPRSAVPAAGITAGSISDPLAATGPAEMQGNAPPGNTAAGAADGDNGPGAVPRPLPAPQEAPTLAPPGTEDAPEAVDNPPADNPPPGTLPFRADRADAIDSIAGAEGASETQDHQTAPDAPPGSSPETAEEAAEEDLTETSLRAPEDSGNTHAVPLQERTPEAVCPPTDQAPSPGGPADADTLMAAEDPENPAPTSTALREAPAESPPSAPAVPDPAASGSETAHAVTRLGPARTADETMDSLPARPVPVVQPAAERVPAHSPAPAAAASGTAATIIALVRGLAPRHRRKDVPPGLMLVLLLAIGTFAGALWLTIFAAPDAEGGFRQTVRQEGPPPASAPGTQAGNRAAGRATGRIPRPESRMAAARPDDAPPAAMTTSPELAGRPRTAETAPPNGIGPGDTAAMASVPPRTAPRPDAPLPPVRKHEPAPSETAAQAAESAAAPQSRTLPDREAERLYAATGIWLRGPAPLPQPADEQADEAYIAAIDPGIPTPDAVALPPLGTTPGDLSPPRVAPPVSPGSRFTLDGRGLVTPSPEGTETPDGIRVYAGVPPVRPPARSASAAAMPAPAAGPDLAGLRPRHRPDDLREISEKAALGGRSRAELSAIRPRPRPAAPQNAPGVNEAPTAQAVAASLKPAHRPRDFAKTVAVIRAAAPPPPSAPAVVADRNGNRAVAPAAAVPRSQTVAPRLPTRASVARQATVANAINLRRINLIGIYGSASKRRALVRLRSGRYVKVAVGDRLNGGRVVAIGENSLRYVKGGRNIVLQMPKT